MAAQVVLLNLFFRQELRVEHPLDLPSSCLRAPSTVLVLALDVDLLSSLSLFILSTSDPLARPYSMVILRLMPAW